MNCTLLAITLSLASICMTAVGVDYVAPKANNIMFYVDKLPIDHGARKNLSISLTILAKRSHGGSAEQHRLTAKLLMLAIRLDRENYSAVKLNNNLSRGGLLPVSGAQEQRDALQVVNEMVKNLSATDKLSEGQVLAAYLKDVLVTLDQNSPLVSKHMVNESRWEGVVPVLAVKNAGIKNPQNQIPREPEIAKKTEPDSDTSDAEKVEFSNDAVYTKWTKLNSEISTPLVFADSLDANPPNKHRVERMLTKISPRVRLESELSLEFKPWVEPEKVEEFKRYIDTQMKKIFGEYESLRIEITTKEKLSANNLRKVAYPLCLQLLASKENTKMNDGLLVLGKLDGQEVTRNPDFWHQLKMLRMREGKNQRLLIPLAAEADLRQLVALEEEDFFVKYEVLLVSNLSESLDLAGESSDALIQQASEEFAKIQEMIGDSSVAPFAVISKVKARLESVLAKNPNHLSAKMILLRGEASRSRKLDSYFVADEFAPLLRKTAYLNEINRDEINGQREEKLASEISSVVEEIYPFVDSEDRELIEYFTEIADLLEQMSRIKNKRASTAVERTMSNALNEFKIKYLKATASIDSAMSSPPSLK